MGCPACGAALGPAAVAEGLARCQWCDHIWTLEPAELAELARAWERERRNPPVGLSARGPRGLSATPPDGVTLQQDDRGVQIRIPWVQDGGLVLHGSFIVLTLAFGAVFVGGLLNGEALEDPLAAVLPFLTFWGMATGYAYVLFNATVLTIGTRAVEVSHGPLPSFLDPDLTVAVEDLARLRVEETVMTMNRGRRTVRHYSLWAGRRRLLRKFTQVEVVDYVADVIADTVDTAVRIECHDGSTR